ncbi:MAG: hypothetical protein Tsb006_7230 [Rickettsiaceae bacterium]
MINLALMGWTILNFRILALTSHFANKNSTFPISSIRVDMVKKDLTIVWDIKFGKSGINDKQLQKIKDNFERPTGGFTIKEVRPTDNGGITVIGIM